MSKKYSAAEQVYTAIKEQILTMVRPGGELISEGEVAEQMGVSRTPVREAFLRLEAQGWMRLYPKRGALILPILDGESEHVLSARHLIESRSVQVLSAQSREDLVLRLREILKIQESFSQSGDLVGFGIADADFHTAIVHAGANPLLDGFYESLRDRQRRMNSRSVLGNHSQMQVIITDHSRLIECIESGDSKQFSDHLMKHMSGVHGISPRGTAQ
ncbi:MAG: GntR family transcriptional regulator [Mycobacteriaceae bacterium]